MRIIKVPLSLFLKRVSERSDPSSHLIKNLLRINKIDFAGNIELTENKSSTPQRICEPGNLVLSGINAAKGSLAIYRGKEPITTSIHYLVFEINRQTIRPDYLNFLIRSNVFKSLLSKAQSGGIKTEIRSKFLLDLEIHIHLSLSDQDLIIKLLDKVFEIFNQLILECSLQLDLIDKIRQSLLTEAFRGETTSICYGNDSLLSTSAMLDNLEEQMNNLQENQQVNSKKLLTKLKSLLAELPKDWDTMPLGKIAFIKAGGTPKAEYFSSDGIPFLKSGNLREGFIDFESHPQYIKTEAHDKVLKSSKAYSGEILMNIIGPPFGKISFIPPDLKELNFNQSIILIRPQSKDLKLWIYYFLKEMSAIKSIEPKGIVGQKNLSIKRLREIPVPIPPAPQREDILGKLETSLKLCKNLSGEVHSQSIQIVKLQDKSLEEKFILKE